MRQCLAARWRADKYTHSSVAILAQDIALAIRVFLLGLAQGPPQGLISLPQ